MIENASLPPSYLDVGSEESCRFGFAEATISNVSMETSSETRSLNWLSFDKFIEKVSPVLSALYLIGAVGFSALLVLDAFPG
jgi:hypothetical protein